MKKKQKLLVALMALTLAGGVGSALALTANAPTEGFNPVGDSAAYVYWNAGESKTQEGVALTDLSAFTKDVAQYRYLQVQTDVSKSFSGTLSVTFTLEAYTTENGKTAVLNGLTVDVYRTAALADNDSVTSAIALGTTTHLTQLKAGTLTVTDSIAIAPLETPAAQSIVTNYAIKFVWDGSSVTGNNVLSGKFTASLAIA